MKVALRLRNSPIKMRKFILLPISCTLLFTVILTNLRDMGPSLDGQEGHELMQATEVMADARLAANWEGTMAVLMGSTDVRGALIQNSWRKNDFPWDGSEMQYMLRRKVSATSDCTILSVGSRNKLAFEREALQKTPCAVLTFDCTVKLSLLNRWFFRGHLASNQFSFHRECWGTTVPTSSKTKARSFTDPLDILQRHNIDCDKVAILKMDIEGSEYNVIPRVLEELKCRPWLLLLEVHRFQGEHTMLQTMELVKGIHDAGYWLYFTEANPGNGCCRELAFVHLHR